jgi:hypothetical protein
MGTDDFFNGTKPFPEGGTLEGRFPNKNFRVTVPREMETEAEVGVCIDGPPHIPNIRTRVTKAHHDLDIRDDAENTSVELIPKSTGA